MMARAATAIAAGVLMTGLALLAVGAGIRQWLTYDAYADETEEEWADRQW